MVVKMPVISVTEYLRIGSHEASSALFFAHMQTFAEDLERVGNFVKVAYYGATAAGPEFSGLQVKIQKIGFQVADLCDASAIVMAKFRDSSASVLDDIQATYEYLIEGEVTTAVEIFKGIAQVAGKMRDAAIQLQKGFEKQKEEVRTCTQNSDVLFILFFVHRLKAPHLKQSRREVRREGRFRN